MAKINRNIIITLFIIVFIFVSYYLIKVQKEEKIKLEQLKFPEIDVFLDEVEISALLVDGDNIYVGGNEGVYLLNGNTGEIIKTISKDLRLIYSSKIIKYKDTIWIAHDDGISTYKNNIITTYSYPLVPKQRCNDIEIYNDIIIAGFESGMAIFDKDNNITILNKNDGLIEDYVNVVKKDFNNNLWIGAYLRTENGGLSILNNNKWIYFSKEQGLIHKFVTSILPIEKSGTIVGCGHLNDGGLTIFKYKGDVPYVFNSLKKEDGLPGDKIRTLYLDTNNYIWITSEADGILVCDYNLVFEKSKLKGLYIDERMGISNNEIKIICENDKYIFLGGKIGLNRIKKDDFYKRLNNN